MKNPLVKKLIIIFSVILVIIAGSVTVALVTGNTFVPSLSDPDGIFYERLDDQGKVIYTITNQELYEEIKSNDGLEQLLSLVDVYLLQDYIANLTQEQIDAKIKKLTYGTSDQAAIDEMDAETKTTLEKSYVQNITLAGYGESLAAQEEYASLLLAREEYARYAIEKDGDITDGAIGDEYAKNWFEDIKAIKIRFTSSSDLKAVMQKFNLVSYSSTSIRSYNGYKYTSESLKQHDDTNKIVEAYTTIDTYYKDASGNLLDVDSKIVYTKGTTNYTDKAAKTYTMDEDGNLWDENSLLKVSTENIFDNKTDAVNRKNANTVYYTVTKTNPFDKEEKAEVKDGDGLTVYTIDKNNKIWDGDTDVTASTNLKVNKVYTDITAVTTITLNNSTEMSEAEVLAAYIKMYNYVYGQYRDVLPEAATAEDLIASDNAYLTHNYDDTKAVQSSLATYMFFTLDLEDDTLLPYSPVGKTYSGTNDSFVYLIYKLNQPAKTNVYQRMIDYVDDIVEGMVPEQTTANIGLPLKSWYGSAITWTASSNATVLTTGGVVTRPATDTTVTLTYKITVGGVTRSNLTQEVLVFGTSSSGSTSEIIQPGEDPVKVETILNDADLYADIRASLIEAKLTGDTAEDTINGKLAALRSECGFEINDAFLGIDYADIDDKFEANQKGHKSIVASLTGRPGYHGATGVTEKTEITADELLEYCLTKNTALYTLYAIQFKEMVYSQYFQNAFGSETDLRKNKSDKMADMLETVAAVKSNYVYYKNLYGDNMPYNTFLDYAYGVYGTKSEYELLRYFVEGAIQPFIVNEAIDEYTLLDLFTDTIQEYYDHYFSLFVTHVLIHFDYDEDGNPDNYDDYEADLIAKGTYDAYLAMVSALETDIIEYLDDPEADDHDFESLVTAYNAATREDETWGVYKQYGLLLMTEELNVTDSSKKVHSLEYSGEYGVKDKYVPEFVQALEEMYAEYQLEQNLTATELRSDLKPTEYGLHLLLVKKGTYFNRYSCAWTEANPASPVYSVGSANPNGLPTADQISLYAQYFFYNTVYDLKASDVEEKYGITVPNLPPTVSTALDFYFSDLLESMYVIGLVNVRTADLIQQGRWATTDYTAEMKTMLEGVRDIYFSALFGKYTADPND
ncbi:MAG TPA: hypothetical protein P5154_04150 [Candidatus Izemoplasmatales bacterium]|nr:hypothetical protein [Bacillota bacterium]HRY77936.1 hypothetical protein [Candidatus Izemoplasmatales bacterium]